ncbi:MAG: AraC family transcriptional regulator [Sphingomonadales bacterium]
MDWVNHIPWAVRSPNVSRVQTQVGRFLKTFRIEPKPEQRYDARVANTRVGKLDLTLVGYGGDITIKAGQLGHFSILQWPLAGHYDLMVDGRSVRIGCQEAHLIAPGVPVQLRFSADCLMLVIRLSAQSARALGGELDAAAAHLTEKEALGIILDLQEGSGVSLKRLLSYLCEEAFTGSLLKGQTDAPRHAEDLFFATLSNALRLPKPGAVLKPRSVLRAEKFMLAHMAEPIGLADVARASGVSASRLTQQFRKIHALPPMKWWRLRRLDRAFDDLSSPLDASSVTDVGLSWGFSHLGRFSSAYKSRFGETPKQTLQRTRSVAGRVYEA